MFGEGDCPRITYASEIDGFQADLWLDSTIDSQSTGQDDRHHLHEEVLKDLWINRSEPSIEPTSPEVGLLDLGGHATTTESEETMSLKTYLQQPTLLQQAITSSENQAELRRSSSRSPDHEANKMSRTEKIKLDFNVFIAIEWGSIKPQKC